MENFYINEYFDWRVRRWNHLRGVKKACDEFLHGKPERVSSIYSGCFSHGFFRKL